MEIFWGKRLEKYQHIARSSATQTIATGIAPEPPDFFIKPLDGVALASYRELLPIPQIFSPLGAPAPGIVTTHDQFAISFSPKEAVEKVKKLISTHSEGDARKIFRLCRQSQWNYNNAKHDLKDLDLANNTQRLLYRPFDIRWTIWNSNVAVHRRERAMAEMLGGDNIALVTSRLTKGESFKHAQVTNRPIEAICMSPLTSNNGFIFLLRKDGKETIDPDIRYFLDGKYDFHYSPEEIIGYIYAVLYAPTYRHRYEKFLRSDFPRIPFPKTKLEFDRLSELGWALVQAHLLKAVPKPKARLGRYSGKGDHGVEQVRWSPAEEAIWINKTQRFAPLPKAVWEFHIGGYQVLDKYLKSRKGRTLSLDEIEHVGKVAETLAFTVDQMELIDEAYRAAFPAGDNAKAPLATSS